jgi:hypothetical protein
MHQQGLARILPGAHPVRARRRPTPAWPCVLALGAALAMLGCRGDRARATPAADAGTPASPASPDRPVVDAVQQAASRSTIRSDEEVVFFPTAGWLAPADDRDGEVWRVPVHGWIYEPELDDLLREALVLSLQEALDADEQQLSSRTLEERLQSFLFDNERGKRIEVEIAGRVHELPPSQADGHFEAVLSLPAAAARAAAQDGRLTVRAITRPEDRRVLAGEIFLVEPRGLLVISDIDDTVKITEVRDRKALLRNTFLEPFRVVPGMAEVYQRWIDRNAGDHLHFVSSSPWQIYPALRALLDQAGFPAATFTLKRVRLKDRSVRALFADPRETKPEAIEALLDAHAGRRVVLVGDSGELDPEVYGEIARRHPQRVAYIAIRDVTGERADGPRYREAFHGLAPELWQIFREPAELRDLAALRDLAPLRLP